MTEGILLYAFNNEVTDYEAIAEWSAKRIKKYLLYDLLGLVWIFKKDLKILFTK